MTKNMVQICLKCQMYCFKIHVLIGVHDFTDSIVLFFQTEPSSQDRTCDLSYIIKHHTARD